MTTIYQLPTQIPGLVGVFPNPKFAIFGDDLTVITTAGYLNQNTAEGGVPLSNSDVLLALYNFNTQTQSGAFGIFTINISSATGQITLVNWANPGEVQLPSTTNYIAHFIDAIGTISSFADNVINPGDIQTGVGATAGKFVSFPGVAASGTLNLRAAQNVLGNFSTEIVNRNSIAQSQSIFIGDSGQANSSFILADSGGTQTINTGSFQVLEGDITAGSNTHPGILISYPPGNNKGRFYLTANENSIGNISVGITNEATTAADQTVAVPDLGTGGGWLLGIGQIVAVGNLLATTTQTGRMDDSGIPAVDVQQKSQILANVTANLGGAGAGPLAVPIPGVDGLSVIVGTILAPTDNPVSILSFGPTGADMASITFSGDPGATVFVQYIVFLDTQ